MEERKEVVRGHYRWGGSVPLGLKARIPKSVVVFVKNEGKEKKKRKGGTS